MPNKKTNISFYKALGFGRFKCLIPQLMDCCKGWSNKSPSHGIGEEMGKENDSSLMLDTVNHLVGVKTDMHFKNYVYII